MKKILLFWAILLTSPLRLFSAEYKLNLRPEQWNINQKGYFLSEIRDVRTDKSIGKVMIQGNLMDASFPASITEDLYQLVKSSISLDTTSVPIIMEIQTFKLSVKGNAAKHQDILDFSIRFIRDIDGEIFELFKLNGKPQMNVQGNIPEVAEKNILAALKLSFQNFDGWMKDNLNIPPMATSVEIKFMPNEILKTDRGDTLIWGTDYKLNWNDFKGPVPPSDFAAESNCMFNYKARPEIADGKMTLFVNFDACFIKGSSWVKEDKLQDSLLLHEQYHFNICEVYARRLKSRLMQLELKPMQVEKQIKAVFNEVWSAYVLAQNEYDEETQHGLITENQNEWIRNVDYWLSK
ncbi:MAG: DUF922 domain-containing protein [Bacteroidetes bacterium]|nr:DUF922 domain-containing protein [Bacteroidota bacterium]